VEECELDSCDSGKEPMADCFETLGSIKCNKFIYCLSDY
jgi:hypothetical protein